LLLSRYSRSATLFFDVPLALLPAKAEEIRAFWESKLAGASLDFEDRQEPFAVTVAEFDDENLSDGGDGPASEVKQQGKIAIIPLRGVMAQRMNMLSAMSGGTSTEAFGAAFSEQVANAEIKAIVIDIDSPGGSSYGVTELANLIMSARGRKPILAIANSVAASAAYWIGAAADRLYATPGALVGSIGVYMLHVDFSKAVENEGIKPTYISAGEHKTRGNQFEPLSDEDLAHFQAIVDDTYGMFVADVARGRAIPAGTVRNGYGKGDVLTASQARKAGMVDGIKTLGEVIAEAGTARPRALRAGASAELAAPDIEATPPPQADEEGEERLKRMRLNSFRARAGLAAVGAAQEV